MFEQITQDETEVGVPPVFIPARRLTLNGTTKPDVGSFLSVPFPVSLPLMVYF